MSHRIDHKDVAAMDATRGKYSSGGSVRDKKAFGDRITKENIVKAADAVAPLAASFITGSLAGAAAYEGVANIVGAPGRARRQERQEKKAEAAKLKEDDEKEESAKKNKARGGRVSRAKGSKAKGK